MKKNILSLTIILFSLICSTTIIQAQEQGSLRDRLAKKQQASSEINTNGINFPKATVRAQMMMDSQIDNISNATWIREIYRFLDLKKEKNAALYYPEQPIGNRMNLYTMLFKLIANNNITVYNYTMNGSETIAKDNILTFKEMAERLGIPLTANGTSFNYNEYDIPSNEILGYYIKEIWFFDQENSVLDVQTAAICPILYRQEYLEGVDVSDMDNIQSQPQFWVPYKEIQAYTSQVPIMTSNLNNILDKTIDDYFKFRLYDGEIYKTTNMENKVFVEKYNTPEELKEARERVEKELNQFDTNLWVSPNDSINTKTTNKKNKKVKKSKSPDAPKEMKYSVRDRR